jgi:hypothetical protein
LTIARKRIFPLMIVKIGFTKSPKAKKNTDKGTLALINAIKEKQKMKSNSVSKFLKIHLTSKICQRFRKNFINNFVFIQVMKILETF